MEHIIYVKVVVTIATNKGDHKDEYLLAEEESVEELFERAKTVTQLRTEGM